MYEPKSPWDLKADKYRQLKSVPLYAVPLTTIYPPDITCDHAYKSVVNLIVHGL